MPLCSLGFFSCLYLKPVLDILRRKKKRDRLYLDTRATHKTQLAKLYEKPWVTQAAFVSTSSSICFSDWLFLLLNIRGTWKMDTPKHQCFFLFFFFLTVQTAQSEIESLVPDFWERNEVPGLVRVFQSDSSHQNWGQSQEVQIQL